MSRILERADEGKVKLFPLKKSRFKISKEVY
jgi:hypothetical protein